MASTSSSATAVELSPTQTDKIKVLDNELYDYNDGGDDIVLYTPPQGLSVNVDDIDFGRYEFFA